MPLNNHLAGIDFGSLIEQATPDIPADTTIGGLVNLIIPLTFTLAGIILLLMLVYGGYNYLTSGGNPKSIERGKGIITSALMGFIIVFISYWIVQLLALFLGLGDIESIFV